MTVEINGQKMQLDGPCSISVLLEQAGIQELRGVALAVNDRVVPRSRWDTHELSDLDKLTVITPTQGG